MANHLIPIAEQMLTPTEVDILDRRRRRGQLYLVIGFQMLLISIFVLLWSGQDATYSPGWHKPMLFWDILLFVGAVTCLGTGVAARRGMNEFFSY
jgi:uncharacterized membrane protein YccC